MANTITNESARINYTPFNACSGFPSSNISIILNNVNTGSMETRSVTYSTNGMITLGSLTTNTTYTYSLSLVVDGSYVCDGSQLNSFMTSATGDDGEDNTLSPSSSSTATPTTTSTTSTGKSN